MTNRHLVLARRPSGMVDETTTRLHEGPQPVPGPGEALVHVRYLSMDPTIRTWMDDAPGYLPPIELGETVRGAGVGEVVESNSDRYAVGDLVVGLTGWQDYVIADEGASSMQVIPAGIDPPLALSVLGVTGLTAYLGMIDVGIAGTPEKCAWIVDELGFDAAVNYRTDDVAASLRASCPDGIDLYYDNVGGEILDICLAQLAMRGRIVMCGAISVYNEKTRPPGPRNILNLIVKRGRMEGFLVLDYLDRFLEGQIDMVAWLAEGRVKHAEHIVEGLEHAPDALNLLFTGGNTGKVIVRL